MVEKAGLEDGLNMTNEEQQIWEWLLVLFGWSSWPNRDREEWIFEEKEKTLVDMFGFLWLLFMLEELPNRLLVIWVEKSKVKSGKMYKHGCQQHVLGLRTDGGKGWRLIPRAQQHLQVERKRSWKRFSFHTSWRIPRRVSYLKI